MTGFEVLTKMSKKFFDLGTNFFLNFKFTFWGNVYAFGRDADIHSGGIS